MGAMMKWKFEKEWTTRAGLKARCVYNVDFGYRCGYVRVDTDSPIYGADYSKIRTPSYNGGDIYVHGGLTFSGPQREVEGGSDYTGWWFGFDCHHYGDGDDKGQFYGPVRSEYYVVSECESLAIQLVGALPC
jgi:hypothetical protein